MLEEIKASITAILEQAPCFAHVPSVCVADLSVSTLRLRLRRRPQREPRQPVDTAVDDPDVRGRGPGFVVHGDALDVSVVPPLQGACMRSNGVLRTLWPRHSRRETRRRRRVEWARVLPPRRQHAAAGPVRAGGHGLPLVHEGFYPWLLLHGIAEFRDRDGGPGRRGRRAPCHAGRGAQGHVREGRCTAHAGEGGARRCPAYACEPGAASPAASTASWPTSRMRWASPVPYK